MHCTDACHTARRLSVSPFDSPGFAFFGVATGIFGFMSYVRNVKPEARLVYYLVRRRRRPPYNAPSACASIYLPASFVVSPCR